MTSIVIPIPINEIAFLLPIVIGGLIGIAVGRITATMEARKRNQKIHKAAQEKYENKNKSEL